MHKITESLYFQPLIHDQKTHFIRVIEFINNLLVKKSATVIFLSIQYQLITITTVKVSRGESFLNQFLQVHNYDTSLL